MGEAGWRRALQEPLVIFLVLGALILGATALWEQRRDASADRIVIDAGRAAHERNLFQVQFGQLPDAAAQEALIQRHIRDEALVREALRLGLEADDEVIRRRLVQKMEFVLTDTAGLPEPDEATLQQSVQTQPERYATPARYSFELRYFSTDQDARAGRQLAPQRAELAMQRLRRGQTAVADSFALGDLHENLSGNELEVRFGANALTQTVRTAPLGQWTGPVQSGFGWHLVKVTARTAELPPIYADVKAVARVHWQEEQREKLREAAIDALVAKHKVLRLDQAPNP